jgi:hypothetical protein
MYQMSEQFFIKNKKLLTFCSEKKIIKTITYIKRAERAIILQHIPISRAQIITRVRTHIIGSKKTALFALFAQLVNFIMFFAEQNMSSFLKKSKSCSPIKMIFYTV